MFESVDHNIVALLVVFPLVGGVVLDGRGESWIDDGFRRWWYNRLEIFWDNVVVLLYFDPLSMVEEVSDEADLDGVLQA